VCERRAPLRMFIDSVHAFGLNACRTLGVHPSAERPFCARENQHSYCPKDAPGELVRVSESVSESESESE